MAELNSCVIVKGFVSPLSSSVKRANPFVQTDVSISHCCVCINFNIFISMDAFNQRLSLSLSRKTSKLLNRYIKPTFH